MGYAVFTNNPKFGQRLGLEGPYTYPNGRTLYYDPVEGAYWDPLTDFYVPHDEVSALQNSIFDLIRG